LADSAQLPRFTEDYIYFFAREAGRRQVIHRIRPDGTGDERIWDKQIWRGSVSPSGRCLGVTLRSPGEAEDPLFTTKIVEWQSGKEQMVCTDCFVWWSDDRAWLFLTRQTGSGDAETEWYLLPTRAGSELPELPPRGLARLSDAMQVKGARIIRGPTNIAFSRSADVYAFLGETVHRNLFRIPLH
jgi:hypothetical protein